MRVTINGEERELPDGASVADVIAQLGMRDLPGIAVELDGRFVERDAYSETRLTQGATMEIVRFVGGG